MLLFHCFYTCLTAIDKVPTENPSFLTVRHKWKGVISFSAYDVIDLMSPQMDPQSSFQAGSSSNTWRPLFFWYSIYGIWRHSRKVRTLPQSASGSDSHIFLVSKVSCCPLWCTRKLVNERHELCFFPFFSLVQTFTPSLTYLSTIKISVSLTGTYVRAMPMLNQRNYKSEELVCHCLWK